MNDNFKELKIDFSEFVLKPEYFDHPGWLHGSGHVYRVMYHALKLGRMLNYVHETKLAFFAAYIHDMSRLHDGRCSEHGQRAADSKLPLFIPLFKRNGMKDEDIPYIYTAVAMHCLNSELPETDPHFAVTALLKDADALDRIRISTNDLKLKFLRLKETTSLLPFAEELFYQTKDKEVSGFEEMITIAGKIK